MPPVARSIDRTGIESLDAGGFAHGDAHDAVQTRRLRRTFAIRAGGLFVYAVGASLLFYFSLTEGPPFHPTQALNDPLKAAVAVGVAVAAFISAQLAMAACKKLTHHPRSIPILSGLPTVFLAAGLAAALAGALWANTEPTRGKSRTVLIPTDAAIDRMLTDQSSRFDALWLEIVAWQRRVRAHGNTDKTRLEAKDLAGRSKKLVTDMSRTARGLRRAGAPLAALGDFDSATATVRLVADTIDTYAAALDNGSQELVREGNEKLALAKTRVYSAAEKIERVRDTVSITG